MYGSTALYRRGHTFLLRCQGPLVTMPERFSGEKNDNAFTTEEGRSPWAAASHSSLAGNPRTRPVVAVPPSCRR